MSCDKTVRIGFVGAGGNTRLRHLPGFREIDGVELAVVANRSTESSQRVAEEFGVGRIADSWRDVVSAPDVDAVCIGTWPNLHAEITIAALAAGKHVLCEARMAASLDGARSMRAAAEARPDLVAQIVPAPFSLDFDSIIQGVYRRGELGRLLEVRVTHTTGSQATGDEPLSWRQDAELSGRNVMSLGILHETVGRWLDDEPEWLVADAAVSHGSRLRSPDAIAERVEIPDSLSVLGRFAKSGARLIYHVSTVESGEPRLEFRLNGSRSALRFDGAGDTLHRSEAGQATEEPIVPPNSVGWRVESDFVASIREGKPVELTDFDSGVKYMTFTEMVDVSWRDQSRRVSWVDV